MLFFWGGDILMVKIGICIGFDWCLVIFKITNVNHLNALFRLGDRICIL